MTLRPDRREGGRTKPRFPEAEGWFGPSSFPSVRPKSHSFFPYFLSYNLVINVRKGRKEGSFGLPSFLPYIKVFVNKLVGGKEGGPSGLPSPQPIYTRILCSRQGGGREGASRARVPPPLPALNQLLCYFKIAALGGGKGAPWAFPPPKAKRS